MTFFKIARIVVLQAMKSILSSYLNIKLQFLKKKNFSHKDVKSILFVCLSPLGIGDLIMNTASIKAYKKMNSKKRIVLFTDRNILNRTKLFDKVIMTKSSFKQMIIDAKKIAKKYDLIIFPNKNLKQSLLLPILLKEYFIGYIDSWKIKANFKLKNPYEYLPTNHYYDMSYNVIKNLGVNKYEQFPEKLYFNKNELTKVKKLIDYKRNDKIILINPFVLWKSRTWPKEKYLSLVEKLLENKKNKIIITGGPEDVTYNKDFDKKFSKQKNYFNLTGKTNLFELAASCSIANLFITGDAGPMHIAVSENCKILSFWGVTDPKNRFPLHKINKEFFYIYPHKMEGAGCYNMEWEPLSDEVIKSISVQEAYKKIKTILK